MKVNVQQIKKHGEVGYVYLITDEVGNYIDLVSHTNLANRLKELRRRPKPLYLNLVGKQ
jgi:hypothetical protein